MLQLSSADLDTIGRMKDFGLLADVDAQKLPDITKPTGMIICSDAHQRKDINSHVSKIWETQNAEELIHEFKDNGLPLMVVDSKIIDRSFKRHLLLLNSIKDAISMGKIAGRIINLGHYPCGAGCKHNLSIYESFDLLVKSRPTVTSALRDSDLNFTVAIQIDFRSANCGKTQNTYHIETPLWEDFLLKENHQISSNLYSRAASR